MKRESNNKIESYITKYLDKSKKITVIDVGAHRGDFINELEKYYRIRRAALIEPTPELAVYLRSRYNTKEYKIVENAISNSDLGFVDFKVNVYGETSSLLDLNVGMTELAGVDTRLEKTIKVSTRRLDTVVKELKFEQIDLIKIDVQGVEHLVLQGGNETLINTRFIWIELSFKPLYSSSSIFHEIYSIMGQNGFILLELSPGHRSQSGELLQADALFANT
ncbi:MAG TPA: FkbM family methyltransferase, partial [Cytophagaceae bacterium]|nr:FkbM family methyltransferase [Cytophagaceae bacterium]